MKQVLKVILRGKQKTSNKVLFTANIQHLCLMFLNPIFSRFTLLQFNVLYGSIIIIHSEMAVPFIIRACMAGVYFDCMGISFPLPKELYFLIMKSAATP